MSAASKKGRRTKTQSQPDPLYVIFEQHLYNFQDSDQDRKSFIGGVVADYLTFLRRKKVSIPPVLENQVIEELGRQVHTMLVKKIYGCFSIEEFRNGAIEAPIRKRARRRYSALKKV